MDKGGQGHKAFRSLPPPLFLFILIEWSSSFSHTLTQLPWLILTRYPHWKLFSLTLDTFVLYQSCSYPGSARWHWITSCLIFENNIIDRTEQCTCWLKDFADVLGIRECPSHLHSCALTVCTDHRLLWGLLATRVSTSAFVTTPARSTGFFALSFLPFKVPDDVSPSLEGFLASRVPSAAPQDGVDRKINTQTNY